MQTTRGSQYRSSDLTTINLLTADYGPIDGAGADLCNGSGRVLSTRSDGCAASLAFPVGTRIRAAPGAGFFQGPEAEMVDR
jgi:hypothetical protein